MGNTPSTPSSATPGSSLRSQALTLAEQRNSLFSQSRAAYSSGKKADAKQLSDKAKALDAQLKDLNAKAAAEIFHHHNHNRDLSEVDLHGLFVEEALHYVQLHIQKCKSKGVKRTTLITGKGTNSVNGIAKIKPAVEELMQKERIRMETDPKNSGVIILELDSDHPGFGGWLGSMLSKVKSWFHRG
ncbi:hypothetical protein HK097_005336 [Rhizophlyctis rosea]|uniref:Smr domain-containing protein n=1 Tax=Rhizophlyctis rosea TaxID=64517 RepID=A0AAD5X9T9_9FUNG|nr:hypothetical protein HK097_005336 [Rhizophlyctis rosea]